MVNHDHSVRVISHFQCLLLVVIAYGCASTPNLSEREHDYEHIVALNYELGKWMSTSVGNRMLRIQDFYLVRISERAYEAVDNIVMDGNLFRATFPVGHQFEIRGKHKKRGTDLVFIMCTDHLGHCLAEVQEDGTLGEESLRTDGTRITPYRYNWVTPARVKRSISTEVLTDRGYTNFELLYSGLDGDTLRISYREFSPEDITHQAFSQSLTYDRDKPIIRFQDMLIELGESSNESITFRVVEAPYGI